MCLFWLLLAAQFPFPLEFYSINCWLRLFYWQLSIITQTGFYIETTSLLNTQINVFQQTYLTPVMQHTCSHTIHTQTAHKHWISSLFTHFCFLLSVSHKWSTMVEGIQNHIGSLNWGYRSALGDKGVKYINGKAEFMDPHTIKVSVCVCVSEYVCEWVCEWVSEWVCVCEWVCVRVSECMSVRVSECVSEWVSMCESGCVSVCVCVFVCVSMCAALQELDMFAGRH